MQYVMVLGFLLTLGATPVVAEPEAVVQYLKSEPASLLDVGQDRAATLLRSERDWFEQSLLRGYRKFIGKDYKDDSLTGTVGIAVGAAIVTYDDVEKRLSINSRIYVTDHMDSSKIKPMCHRLVTLIREIGDVINGKVREGDYSTYAAGFSHLGYESRRHPKDYRQQLDQMFQIKVAVYGAESFRPIVWCQGKLLSNEVTFAE